MTDVGKIMDAAEEKTLRLGKRHRFTIVNPLLWLFGAVAIGVCAFAYVTAYGVTLHKIRNVVIINQGNTAYAEIAPWDIQREREAVHHVVKFHKLLFNISQSPTVVRQNIEKALNLADESAYAYYTDLAEQKYYSRLVAINGFQEVKIDTVITDMSHYPYKVETIGEVFVLDNDDKVAVYRFDSTGELMNVPRTKDNPNGFRLCKFLMKRYQEILQ